MIALVDYGMGNLKSVANAFEALGHLVQVTQEPRDLERAHAIVLPGVGAFGDGMRNLRQRNLIEVLRVEVLEKKKPYLGICLGMQFLAQESWEGERQVGLGWIPGVVQEIRPSERKYKVPHMGWNNLKIEKESEIFSGLPEEPVFYFVHSFHLAPTAANTPFITATCQHGITITAALQRENIYGVQFHPEKSQRVGLQLLKNFTALAQSYAEKTADPCPHPA